MNEALLLVRRQVKSTASVLNVIKFEYETKVFVSNFVQDPMTILPFVKRNKKNTFERESQALLLLIPSMAIGSVE